MRLRVAGVELAVETAGLSSQQLHQLRRQWGRVLAEPWLPTAVSDQHSPERPTRYRQPMSVRVRVLSSTDHGGSSGAVNASLCAPVTASAEAQWRPAADFAALASQVSTRVTLAVIAALSGGPLLFHAAAVADSQGRVIGLIAPSGTGKTTASCQLGGDYGYVSDETLIVDPDLTVHPYPKPLSLIRSEGEPKYQASPDELGLGVPPRSLRLHRVALLVREPDAAAPRLQFTDLLDGLARMIPETSALARTHLPLQRISAVLALTGAVAELVYRDASELPQLLKQLSDRVPEPLSVGPMPGITPRSARSPNSGEASREQPIDRVEAQPIETIRGCTREPVHDALIDGRRALVMCGAQVALLDGMGVDLWEAAGQGLTVEDAVVLAQERHGPHTQATHVIRTQMASMARAGIVSTW